MTENINLNFGFSFNDLYQRDGLVRIDAKFLEFLRAADEQKHDELVAARVSGQADSALLVALAPEVEKFIAVLFGVEKELTALNGRHIDLTPLYTAKRLFVQRRAAKTFKQEEAATFDGAELKKQLEALVKADFSELDLARKIVSWMEDEAANVAALDIAARYSAWVLYCGGRSILFSVPPRLDFNNLVDAATAKHGELNYYEGKHLRQRDGFDLTDNGADLSHALDESNYCIFCHEQGKDSCSKGLREKTGAFKTSPTKVELAGCPLTEKISEMNMLKSAGNSIGALAVVTVDNPMMAGTGHRICNDCMKSCIYQKQQPVNIPQVETRTLKDVLELPWGFEIYSLLTRWNPLNISRPLPRENSGKYVLVVGMGPAGYTLAHHLINDGHNVVAIDGLKLEPNPVPFAPVKDIATLQQPLSKRIAAGFGGVAEYGITSRWDKNFLTIIRQLLERRIECQLIGGVRFGGTIDVNDAWAMGFDHIALCLGAGKPTLLDIPNGMARGVRAASDFLMALQLTGAARAESIANLQIRLPAVVIGGGLTGIDTTTEVLAYYAVQVEKFLSRYEKLVAASSEDEVKKNWSEEDRIIAAEYISHARALRAEGADRIKLLRSWGGATLCYRKSLQDSPSYRLNHEEVELALQEGIYFLENCAPVAVAVDKFGHAEALKVRASDGGEHSLPARSILVAAGTSPNTVLAREYESEFPLDGKYFTAVDAANALVKPERTAKPAHPDVLHRVYEDGRGISFFGDLHPSFAGNVVKAMASAKQGYPAISELLKSRAAGGKDRTGFFAALRENLTPVVREVNRLTPTIIELVIYAPQAAKKFQPGQFFRLQNFEAGNIGMEGLALTGAAADPASGLISTIILEMGGSSDLCHSLKPGEPVILMGPTGTPSEIPHNQTVILAGGGLGNAVLFSIGKAMRANGCKVVYFAGYRGNRDRFKLSDIEAAADVVVWCCDEKPDFTASRPQDMVMHGNIVEAMLHYSKQQPAISLSDASHMLVIGSDKMMAGVAAARHGVLKDILKPDHIAIGSINSPMQCMMKEICAQCIQKHVDPKTGEEKYVFSCFNQDQELDCVSFPHLAERLAQNRLQEKLTKEWIDRL